MLDKERVAHLRADIEEAYFILAFGGDCSQRDRDKITRAYAKRCGHTRKSLTNYFELTETGKEFFKRLLRKYNVTWETKFIQIEKFIPVEYVWCEYTQEMQAMMEHLELDLNVGFVIKSLVIRVQDDFSTEVWAGKSESNPHPFDKFQLMLEKER